MTVGDAQATTLERLARAGATHPDLQHLLPFWGAIYRLQMSAREELAAQQPPLRWIIRAERVAAGRPQLDVDDLPLTPEPLRALAGRLESTWRQHDPERPASQEVDWPRRVRLAFADPTLAFGQRRDLAPEAALAALALVPYLEWAAEAVVPALRGALPAWGRGVCPVCGGHPDLAILVGEPATRRLACSRCNSQWHYRRVGCPFCNDVERQAYHTGEGGYRLYLCQACRRYLKTIEAYRLEGDPDPRVERLITVGMDLAALEAGYGPGN